MVSKQLAKFILETEYESLPEIVISRAKDAIMDWAGMAAVGYMRPSTKQVLELCTEEGGAQEVSLVGTGQKASSVWAALVNGISAHAVDMDDLHRNTSLHPGAAVISAAMALAEKRGYSGKELIAAVVIGYDIAIRIAESVMPSHNDHWYITGTCGTFGAAAAAARLAGLTEEQTVYALSNAGMQSSGMYELNVGRTSSKQLNAGKAAMDGLLAVLLAEKNYEGPERILEGSNGFFRIFSSTAHEKYLDLDLGKLFKITETSVKLYPSARHTHAAIDLSLRLLDRGITAKNIELIRIKSYKRAKETVSNLVPENVEEAKHSMPYCVAATLAHGLPWLDTFAESRIDDDLIQQTMSHCTVEVDPELEQKHPEFWPVTLEVIDSRSHIIREQTDYPKGDPENPVSETELQDKFTRLVAKMIGAKRTEELLGQLRVVDKLENVRELELFKKE